VADVRFDEDRAGVAAMLRTPAMLAAMEHLGDIVRIEAERTAAVDTGAYAFGLKGGPGVTGGGFEVDAAIRNGVASVVVSNDVQNLGYAYGVAQEFGNGKITARHTLGNALDALSTHI
jgi:hypothetical protein